MLEEKKETKELKEEDLNKVSGGNKYVQYYCNKCKKPFNADVDVKKCPYCASDDFDMVPLA